MMILVCLCFSDLLESNSDGIEVSYNACGVLAHMVSDGPGSWEADIPSRKTVLQRMIGAISHWKINTKRNINYRLGALLGYLSISR